MAFVGLLAGLIVVIITPKEEEPQIDVTMADVIVAFPGASAQQVESLIAIPGERILDEIEGIEHIYSMSAHGRAVITVQFEVGIPRQEALVRLYNQVFSHSDWFPDDLGAHQPVVRPLGIDDVPILSLTLFDPSGRQSGEDLTRLARALEVELKRVPGTRDVFTIGAVPDRVDILFDPALLAGFGLSVTDLAAAIQASNAAGAEVRITRDGVSIPIEPGQPLTEVDALPGLVVGLRDGAAVYLSDVAEIRRGETVPDAMVQLGFGPGAADHHGELFTAVTLAIAKKPGENAVVIARDLQARVDMLRGRVIPDDIGVQITRDYGKTAGEKSRKLITDLVMATFSVVLLVLAAMGWRQALIVGLSVIVTLLLTLVFSWAWGFTLNRVSLFALIFSIGILVDDAIVIVENISRRLRSSDRGLREIIPAAVDEVGTPTIMATLTVTAALLPMAFVTGLMGPYMSPIPINASAGMVISQIVAFVLAPWLAVRLLRHDKSMGQASDGGGGASAARGVNKHVQRFFRRLFEPFLGAQVWRRRGLAAGVIFLTLVAASLPVFTAVILKMLPFDDKSEVQVVIDMPEHTPVEQTLRVLTEMGRYLETVPEVSDWQAYAGTASPINFNGLVRQYYLRAEPWQGDLQINLIDDRRRQSHDIAQDLRDPLTEIGKRFGAAVKIVEVPPGPPVLSPVVAEVYGPDHETRAALA
ncbi:MAG: efflux RND transporter permease subunit, partial [Wenzhouxiangella sp.]